METMGRLGQARATMDTMALWVHWDRLGPLYMDIMGPLGQDRPNIHSMGPLEQAGPTIDLHWHWTG